MAIPYPTDPSLPSNPAPLFSDSTVARGDHLRANNAEIWANFTEIVETILGNASLSTDGTFAALSDLLFPSEKAVNTYLRSIIDTIIPPGILIDYAGITPPVGNWMGADGSSLLRASYPTCWANLHSVIGECTISIASPGVVTYVLHPFITGDCVHLTTTGALPTGLSASTNYYVIKVDGNTFQLATSYANAIANSAINTSGTQSGIHSVTWIPWGAADATHFFLPDTQGISTEGSGQLTTNGAAWGGSNYIGRLGQYKQDQGQAWQLGIEAFASSTVYYGFNRVDAMQGGSTTAGHGTLDFTVAGQGSAKMAKGYNDGTYGTPRTGHITAGPRVGVNKIIRVL